MIFDTAGIIAAFVALALGIGNMIYSSRINERVRYVGTVTSQRIKWLDDLRNNIAEFCGNSYYWAMTPKITDEESKNIIKYIDKLRVLIKLQLIEKNDSAKAKIEKKIIEYVDRIPDLTHHTKKPELKDAVKLMTVESQKLFSMVWGKIERESIEGKLEEPEDCE